jgi:hypothetical protein
VLDVPMTARGERKEALPIDKMEEIKEDVEEEVKVAEEKIEQVTNQVQEEVKVAEEKVEKELQEVNALVNDIKEHGIKEVSDSIENIEIKIKPPKGCCVIQ